MSIDIPEIRNRIEDIEKDQVRNILKLQFLTGCRIGEICGKESGLSFKDLLKKDYDGHPLALFTIHTEKKGGELRYVAVPMEEQYEPWTKQVLNECWPSEKEFVPLSGLECKVFNISIRNVQLHAERAFRGLTYPIEKYTDKEGIFIPRHEKHGITHFLRHARATNLIMDYGLDGVDVGIMLGWANPGLPNMARRYVVMGFQRYFPKLLKPYNQIMKGSA